MNCSQQMQDTAEFNRLLIEENRRFRSEIQSVREDYDELRFDADRLRKTLSDAALHGAYPVVKLEELPEFLRVQREAYRTTITRLTAENQQLSKRLLDTLGQASEPKPKVRRFTKGPEQWRVKSDDAVEWRMTPSKKWIPSSFSLAELLDQRLINEVTS